MKRILVAAALAAPFIAQAQSSVTISGGFATGFKHSAGKSDGTASKNEIANLDAAVNNLTFRGVEDLGGGLKATFLLNHRFQPDTGMQTGSSFYTNTKLGLSGGFGEIAVGKMWAPVDELLRRVLDVYTPMGLGPTVYGGPLDAPTRYDNLLMYTSPNMGGLRAAAGVVLKDDMVYPAGAPSKQHTTELAARYQNGPMTLGLGYTVNAGTATSAVFNVKNRDVLTVGGRYDFDKIKLGLTYSKVSADGTVNDSDRYSFGARYVVNNTLGLKFGYEHQNQNKGTKTNAVALGAEYTLSKRTMLFTEIGRVDSDVKSRDEKGATFLVGVAHRF